MSDMIRVSSTGFREVLGIENFTAADIEAIRRAEPSEEAEAFNHELPEDLFSKLAM